MTANIETTLAQWCERIAISQSDHFNAHRKYRQILPSEIALADVDGFSLSVWCDELQTAGRCGFNIVFEARNESGQRWRKSLGYGHEATTFDWTAQPEGLEG